MAALPGLIAVTHGPVTSFPCPFPRPSRRRSTADGRRRRCSVRLVTTCRGEADDAQLRRRQEGSVERWEPLVGDLVGRIAGLGVDMKSSALGPPIPAEYCPPFSETIYQFEPPPVSRLRVRPAAHLVDEEYIKKLEKGIRAMKDLPDDDPRNFYQQSMVYRAYCNDAHDQPIHASWLFFPWHRLHLYFYERILGNLLGDETLAIPFWNWDNPHGMVTPTMYTSTRSPLYNPNRNPSHLQPNTVILDYGDGDPAYSDRERQIENLSVMYRTMVSGGKTAELFMGEKFTPGMDPYPGAGSLERSLHNNVHVWCCNPKTTYGEDMGNFYYAGRDCLFYAHLANVDRMWYVWNSTLGKKNFADDDFRNANFVFYDEKKNLVRVNVSDSFDVEKLGYRYQDQDLPWLKASPTRTVVPAAADQIKEATAARLPLVLSSTVSFTVKRPKKSRGEQEKAAEEEVLIIRGIELPATVPAKFDVYVNAPDTSALTPASAEYAGCFSTVPHKKEGAVGIRHIKTSLKLALTDLLKEIGADGDHSIVVTLVPRSRVGNVKINQAPSIGFSKIE